MKYTLLFASLVFAIVCGCKKDKAAPVPPSLTTTAVTNISFNTATTGGTINSNGGAAITGSGVCWSKTNVTPTLTDSVVSSTTTSGSFTSTINNLVENTTYYVRAYATNSAGTGYGNVVTFSTTSDTTKVTFTYNGILVTYNIIRSPISGKKWMDRNLGASRAATASNDDQAYGDLFQWGRLADGHQIRTSGTTTTLATSNTPGHGNFILTADIATWYDWLNPQNNNLWQGSSGINNPCPTGWHVPTKGEWETEVVSITNANTAYTSHLKLAAGGRRPSYLDGSILGESCTYWSSTSDGNFSTIYLVELGASYTAALERAMGASVRCIKD